MVVCARPSIPPFIARDCAIDSGILQTIPERGVPDCNLLLDPPDAVITSAQLGVLFPEILPAQFGCFLPQASTQVDEAELPEISLTPLPIADDNCRVNLQNVLKLPPFMINPFAVPPCGAFSATSQTTEEVESSVSDGIPAAGNKPGSANAASISQIAGTTGALLAAVNGAGYSGLADGQPTETYTVTVTQASTAGDATTARLDITSDSGSDDQVDVTPSAFGAPTAIGTRGLLVTWTQNTQLNFSVGQKWRVTVAEAYTPPSVEGDNGAFNGDVSASGPGSITLDGAGYRDPLGVHPSETYFISFVGTFDEFGNGASDAVFNVTTASGTDNVSGQIPLGNGVLQPIGRRGLRVAWPNVATLMDGQVWTVSVTETRELIYTVTVTQGGQTDSSAQVTVTASGGFAGSGPHAVNDGATIGIGDLGVEIVINGAQLVSGDAWTINVGGSPGLEAKVTSTGAYGCDRILDLDLRLPTFVFDPMLNTIRNIGEMFDFAIPDVDPFTFAKAFYKMSGPLWLDILDVVGGFYAEPYLGCIIQLVGKVDDGDSPIALGAVGTIKLYDEDGNVLTDGSNPISYPVVNETGTVIQPCEPITVEIPCEDPNFEPSGSTGAGSTNDPIAQRHWDEDKNGDRAVVNNGAKQFVPTDYFKGVVTTVDDIDPGDSGEVELFDKVGDQVGSFSYPFENCTHTVLSEGDEILVEIPGNDPHYTPSGSGPGGTDDPIANRRPCGEYRGIWLLGGTGGGGVIVQVVSGTGDTYLCDFFEDGPGEPATRQENVTQLQILGSEEIPAGTWAIATEVAGAYYMQVSVWLG